MADVVAELGVPAQIGKAANSSIAESLLLGPVQFTDN